MENTLKKCTDYTWIFPDIIGDNHTTRLQLSLILFSSYLLIFNQLSVNREYNEFLNKYQISTANETPEKFLLIEKEFFGLKDEINKNLSYKYF